MSDANSTLLWYICVDHSHKMISALASINFDNTHVVCALKVKLCAEDVDCRNVVPDSLNIYHSCLTVADAERDEEAFPNLVSAFFLEKRKPLGRMKKVGDCGIGEEDVLFVEFPSPPPPLAYHLFDDRRIIEKDSSIRLKDHVRFIGDLVEAIQKQHDLSNGLFVYRCHQTSPQWEDDEDELHRQILEVIKDKKGSGDKQTVEGLEHKIVSVTQLFEGQIIEELDPRISEEETFLVRLVGLLPVPVWFQLVDHQKNVQGVVWRVFAADVIDLRHRVKDDFSNDLENVDAMSLTVWHCKTKLYIGATGDEIKNLNLVDDATRLEAEAIWDLHLDNDEMLIVQMPDNNNTTRDTDSHLASSFAKLALYEFHKQRLEVFGDAEKGFSPSEGAQVTTFLEEQNSDPIFNGRPANNLMVPVGLYHDAFNTFQARLSHSSAPDTPRAHDSIYEKVDELLQCFAKIYSNEESRSDEIMPLMEELLGESIAAVTQPDVSSDGTIETSCGRFSAFLAIIEMKNEIGTGDSDPYHQAGLAYRKYWTDEKYKPMVPFYHFPSFLISIAGPCIMVSGAIYLDKFMIQPLTEYIWFGGAPRGHSWVPKAVQLFAALRDGISELKSYYENLEMARPISQFPFVTSFHENELETEWEYQMQPFSEKLVYEAKRVDGKEIIIKFALIYNEEAHKLLADAGYAPELYHVSRKLYGGLRMIVMEKVVGRKLQDGERLNSSQYSELKEMLRLLHDRGIVHGDVRTPNIIITDQKGSMDDGMGREMKKEIHEVMLIDFDDCGQAGVGKYAADLNMGLGWPEGVGRECIMQNEHDEGMLKKLEPFDYI